MKPDPGSYIAALAFPTEQQARTARITLWLAVPGLLLEPVHSRPHRAWLVGWEHPARGPRAAELTCEQLRTHARIAHVTHHGVLAIPYDRATHRPIWPPGAPEHP
ncbi:hypothetical protein GKE82_23570 [Conexibacter sp. W3-3-2]|uniref:hypothetical protein n=1 Tax=Conexibacter sp. W3-3-2 TaxID=2675227 RepID=UPI0012B8A753|nr:hypothetical protein [Conexibacter sp. W3-3-2]MTD47185.1 hypothetical protein [Conexibacter sp. W3-3-2]